TRPLLSAFEQPNATLHLLPEAVATQERRLEAVGCRRSVRRSCRQAPWFVLSLAAKQFLCRSSGHPPLDRVGPGRASEGAICVGRQASAHPCFERGGLTRLHGCDSWPDQAPANRLPRRLRNRQTCARQ